MEMGVVSSKFSSFYFWMISGYILLNGCSGPQEISGIYQNLHNYQSGNFGFSTLILKKDSTFQFNEFGDEICYQSNFGACGSWKFANDSIYLKLFDTISLQIKYLPDSSDQLTIEIFDNYGCQFLIPAFLMHMNEEHYCATVGFGYYRGHMPENVSEVLIFAATNLNTKPHQIKRDSMHIQIHGMSMGYSHSVEEMRFVQKGSNLYKLYKSKNVRNNFNSRNKFRRKENLEYFEYMYR